MKPLGKQVVLGVTGSIAAYKAVHFLRLLTGRGHDVQVIMTPAARRFVGELTFEALSSHPVLWEQFAPGGLSAFPHIKLGRSGLMVIAPATAGTIGKMAAGIADNLLLSTYLAMQGQVIVCPAMNQGMWRHPAVKENIETLTRRGVKIVHPAGGRLACGEEGQGRMEEPDKIIKIVDSLTTDAGSTLAGKRVLITAGATREPIDSVRFISNRSSGKMGFAMAQAALLRGAAVTVISANCGLNRDARVRYIEVDTADEMDLAVRREFDSHDILVMAAAVADFKVSSGGTMGKIERKQINDLQLEPTSDIVSNLREYSNGKVKVGFAAEFGNHNLQRARKKLKSKGLDLIVFNDVSRRDIGFETEENELVIMSPDRKDIFVEKTSKINCANRIFDCIEELL